MKIYMTCDEGDLEDVALTLLHLPKINSEDVNTVMVFNERNVFIKRVSTGFSVRVYPKVKDEKQLDDRA